MSFTVYALERRQCPCTAGDGDNTFGYALDCGLVAISAWGWSQSVREIGCNQRMWWMQSVHVSAGTALGLATTLAHACLCVVRKGHKGYTRLCGMRLRTVAPTSLVPTLVKVSDLHGQVLGSWGSGKELGTAKAVEMQVPPWHWNSFGEGLHQVLGALMQRQPMVKPLHHRLISTALWLSSPMLADKNMFEPQPYVVILYGPVVYVQCTHVDTIFYPIF